MKNKTKNKLEDALTILAALVAEGAEDEMDAQPIRCAISSIEDAILQCETEDEEVAEDTVAYILTAGQVNHSQVDVDAVESYLEGVESDWRKLTEEQAWMVKIIRTARR